MGWLQVGRPVDRISAATALRALNCSRALETVPLLTFGKHPFGHVFLLTCLFYARIMQKTLLVVLVGAVVLLSSVHGTAGGQTTHGGEKRLRATEENAFWKLWIGDNTGSIVPTDSPGEATPEPTLLEPIPEPTPQPAPPAASPPPAPPLGEAFNFEPSTICVGVATSVFITVDLNGVSTTENIDEIESFGLYRADPQTGNLTSTILTELVDDGSLLSSDMAAGDNIFSNQLAVSLEAVGDVEAYVAIPFIGGLPNFASSLVFTALSAVSSTDSTDVCGNAGEPSPGIGGGGNFTVPSVTGLELFIQYSWPADQADLDTGTEFLNQQIGFACGSSIYMSFSGDDTGFGGFETIIVDIAQALQDGAWSMTTTVFLKAGWYIPAGGSGPADVRILFRDRMTGEEVPGTGLSVVYNPGEQSDCAATVVGTVELSIGDDGVTIEMTYVPGPTTGTR